MTLRLASQVSLWLGVLSVLAVVVANLALQDIYHREPDVMLEWRLLRVSFLIIIVFHAFALTTAWKAVNQPEADGSRDPH